MPMPQMQEQLLISPNNDGLRRVQTAGGSNMGTGLRGTKERTLAGRAQRPNLQPYTGSQAKQYMHARSFKKPSKKLLTTNEPRMAGEKKRPTRGTSATTAKEKSDMKKKRGRPALSARP